MAIDSLQDMVTLFNGIPLEQISTSMTINAPASILWCMHIANAEKQAAVLGGTQSLHTNSMDEVLALPTEKAVQIALRTQQIIAYETGAANVIDPLAGSYFVEALNNKMEAEAEKYFEEIDRRGGVLAAIDQDFFQQEIADAAYHFQRSVDIYHSAKTNIKGLLLEF